MSDIIQFGIEKVRIGDIDTPLDNPFVFKDFPVDTVSVVFGEPTVTPIAVDDSSTPITTSKDAGEDTFNFSTYGINPFYMEQLFGGTVTGGVIVTAATISFEENGTTADTISDSGSGFGDYADGDVIKVSGSTSNDGVYLIATATAAALTLDSSETLSDEAAAATVTVQGGRYSVTASDIAFVDGSASADTITSVGADFGSLNDGDLIIVSGSTSNDGVYRATTAVAATLTLVDSDSVSTEGAGASITIKGAEPVWKKSSETVTIEKSMEITTKPQGGFKTVWTAQKVDIVASLAGVANNSSPGQIDIIATVLSPASGEPVKSEQI